MTTIERSAIQQAGQRGDAAALFADSLAVCEQILATFHHADGCGPAYYQMARDVVSRVKPA